MNAYSFILPSLLIAFISFILMILMVVLMGAEGRFFLFRGIGKKGIDLIELEPLSNALKLTTIHWNGEYFENKKRDRAIYFGFDKMLRPDTDNKKYFNDVMGRSCHWKGARRPVLISSEIVGIVANPHMHDLIARTKHEVKYKQIKGWLDYLQTVIDPENFRISYNQLIKPDDLVDYLETASPSALRNSFDKGRTAGKLEMTRDKGVPNIVKFAIPVGIVIIGLVLWQAGVFDNLLKSGKQMVSLVSPLLFR